MPVTDTYDGLIMWFACPTSVPSIWLAYCPGMGARLKPWEKMSVYWYEKMLVWEDVGWSSAEWVSLVREENYQNPMALHSDQVLISDILPVNDIYSVGQYDCPLCDGWEWQEFTSITLWPGARYRPIAGSPEAWYLVYLFHPIWRGGGGVGVNTGYPPTPHCYTRHHRALYNLA